jgi:hypothetical protein
MTTPNTAVNPTWTWGSSGKISLSLNLGGQFQNSTQLAQVSLPEPAVCSIYFQATVLLSDPSISQIGSLTLNLSQGLGRVTIPRQISFAGQPANNAPIEWTIPFIPLHALQADVTANMIGNGAGTAEIQLYLVLSPLTRIPQKIQQLQFGMATPGEADAADDELLENLEEEAPTVTQIMSEEAHERVHGAEPEPDDDDGGDEPQAAPAWMMDLVDALTRRLHRAPSRQELRAAVTRLRERQAKRAGR